MKLRTILGAAIASALFTSVLQGGDAPPEGRAERGGGGGFSMHSRDAAGQGSTLVD